MYALIRHTSSHSLLSTSSLAPDLPPGGVSLIGRKTSQVACSGLVHEVHTLALLCDDVIRMRCGILVYSVLHISIPYLIVSICTCMHFYAWVAATPMCAG